MNIFNYYLGELLFLANVNKPSRHIYFPLKDKILNRFGVHIGYDLQHVKKECYTCNGTGWYTVRDRCYNCRDGIYSEFWCKLSSYELGNRKFYIPSQKYYMKPSDMTVNIEGIIKNNNEVEFIKSYRAFMFLRCIFQPKEYLKTIFSNWFWIIHTKYNYYQNICSRFLLKIKQTNCKHDFGDNSPFCEKCDIYNPEFEDLIPF